MFFKREHREHRGIARGANRHHIMRTHARRNFDEPISFHAGFFCKATIMRFRKTITIEQNRITAFEIWMR